MSSSTPFVSTVGPVIERYLILKEALGRRFDSERAVLRSLDSFLATVRPGPEELSSETFTRWCQTLHHLATGVRRNRMRVVRNFCLYCRRTKPGCFVPDPALLPAPHQSVRPYIFTKAEITRLLSRAASLGRTNGSPLRSEVYRLAIVLLYTTGLRRGELLRTKVGDYDHAEKALLVRASKFHKSRWLPLSKDAARELESYLKTRRAHRLPVAAEAPLLWNGYAGGRGYSGGGFAFGLHELFKAAGIRGPDGQLPRVHDVRHTFAVHALLRWYQSGVNVQAKLPQLATYMGHVSVVSTEYYLQFIEPIATLASDRFAQRCGELVTPAPKLTGGDR